VASEPDPHEVRGSDATITSAARRWDAARIEVAALRKKRASFACEREAYKPQNEGGNTPPCWKQRVCEPVYDCHGPIEDDGRLDPSDFCGPCAERQVIYLRLRDANKKRGAALRSLQMLLAAERKRLGLDERYERKPVAP